jgi:hypothetical protein
VTCDGSQSIRSAHPSLEPSSTTTISADAGIVAATEATVRASSGPSSRAAIMIAISPPGGLISLYLPYRQSHCSYSNRDCMQSKCRTRATAGGSDRAVE